MKNYSELVQNDQRYIEVKNERILIEASAKNFYQIGKNNDIAGKQVGEKSSDALEMALSDKIEKLNEEITTLRQKNKELEKDNSSTSSQLSKLKSTLSGLLG